MQQQQEYYCIKHSDDAPYINLLVDYFELYHGWDAQVVIMQLLEDAPRDEEWTPLTFERFRLLAHFMSVDREQFNAALAGLVEMGHLLKQGDAYHIDVPVVQKALDTRVIVRPDEM